MHQHGEVIAGFYIERLLGSGGMGEVYLVRHPRLPRLDALKLLPTSASSDDTYRERFLREADLAAQLDHDNVVTVFDRGETDGQLWIHMKYVPGQDASAALRAGGPFTARRALHTVSRVAAALDAAHRHGLLHRDVKPANILLGTPNSPDDPERVFLTDFGIAKGVGEVADLTPRGHFAASLDYASPEQIQVRELDGRTDQYALGCVLFQLLTGSIPYPGDGPWAKMNAHLTQPVPKVGLLRPGLPPAVQSVLDRALAKDPRDRFDSCAEMAAALGSALQDAPTGLPGPRQPVSTKTSTAPVTTPPAATEPVEASQPPTAAEPTAPVPLEPAWIRSQWWRRIDRGAGACIAAAVVLCVLSAFAPTASVTASRYPGEIPTGDFAAAQLPSLLLLLVGIGLQLTRFGHRYRPLICGVAAGAGAFTALDSLRVYAFTGANPGGAYDSPLAHSNAAIPRTILGLLVVLVALTGVLRLPARQRPGPHSHVLVAMVLTASAIVLTIVAIIIGPVIQLPRLHQLAYGVPLASALGAAALLVAAVLSRRMPLLVASLTVTACAAVADAVAPEPLHYPLSLLADVWLATAVVILLLAWRQQRPADPPAPPPPAAFIWNQPLHRPPAQHPQHQPLQYRR